MQRESQPWGKAGRRTLEIQRLIGRSRACRVNLNPGQIPLYSPGKPLPRGEKKDVIQGRTAAISYCSITGPAVALVDAFAGP